MQLVSQRLFPPAGDLPILWDSDMTSIEIPSELARRLHREADAAKWDLSVERLSAACVAGVVRTRGDRPIPAKELEQVLSGLHLCDLALATACVDGHELAWEHFIREYRPGLSRAAEAMRPGRGQELADALYAELFGVSNSGRAKTSLFRYFHGRSSLATWLRAVLAQRLVDAARSERRLDPWPDDDVPRRHAPPPASPSPDRARWLDAVQRALSSVIHALAPRNRLRLACYYVESMTLAEIGRALGEHEATVSRHLARTRRSIRGQVEQALHEQERMSAADIAECIASVTADAGTLDMAALINAPPSDGETSGAAGRAGGASGVSDRKRGAADRSTEGERCGRSTGFRT